MTIKTILLEDEILEQSREVCKYLSEPDIRNKAVANVLAAKIAEQYFSEYQIDTTSSLHNIHQILCDWEISDIYINNVYIDVRLYFEEKDLCIPKLHFDNDLLPVAYMFLKLEKDLSSATVTGFITPDLVTKEKEAEEYYFIEENELLPLYEIEDLLSTETINLPDDLDVQIFDSLDGKIDLTSNLFKILLKSKEARFKFIDIAKTKTIFNFVSIDSAFIQDDEKPSEIIDSTQELDLLQSEELIDLTLQDGIENDSFNEEDLETTETTDILSGNEGYEFPTETTPGIQDIERELDSLYPLEEIVDENVSEEESDIIEAIDINTEDSSLDTDILDSDEMDTDQQSNLTVELDNEDNESLIEEASILISEDNQDDFENIDITDEITTEPALILDESNESIENANFSEANLGPQDLEAETEPQIEEQDYSRQIIEDSDNNIQGENIPVVDDISSEEEDESIISENYIEEALDENENTSQIETLFETNESQVESEVLTQEAPKKRSAMSFLSLIAIIGAIGYFSYTKLITPNNNIPEKTVKPQVIKNEEKNNIAMPVETIENITPEQKTEEGNALSLPAIEKNLDASILVSNLSVNWEVPSSYISNITAKRYFTKLGKIVQLNLKTELLLLSKPPITNKIVLDLEFNKSLQKFTVKGVSISSGEKSIDDIIIKTINSVLSMNMSSNMGIFNNLQGNPSLVIRL